MKVGLSNGTIRIPVASNYDLDNDYDYIMSRALRSYKQHRDSEKADCRRGFAKRFQARRHRPKTAPPSRYVTSVKIQNLGRGDSSQGRPRDVFSSTDVIQEVQEANRSTSEDGDRSSRRVLQVAKVSVKMLQEQTKKAQSYLRRNSPSHSWYSHSYPTVKPLEKFVRPPYAYMSASVGERDLASALSSSSSRSSSTKSSPKHGCCRPKSASAKNSNDQKYDYDGGLFTHPKNHPNDFFVIHPDWVSESMTIQKLSLTERTRALPKSRSMTIPGRRCNSAPPPKYRNPITWETTQTT